VATLVDSYSESNQDSYSTLNSSTYVAHGQSFTGSDGKLDSAKFYMKKAGTPSGNIYAYLYAHSGTFGTSSVPTGSALATSDAVDFSTVETSAYALYTFVFSGANRYTLADATHYVLVLSVQSATTSTGNGIMLGNDASSPSHDGNSCRYLSSWASYGSRDDCFYVYKADAAGLPIPLLNHLLLGD
jgi:hypothetical protein